MIRTFAFFLPSDFVAQLGFGADIYDGVLLIDTINRTLLPAFSYPFAIGDELVAVDGVAVEQWLQDFGKYTPQGNPVSTRRLAAARITFRPQSRMPACERPRDDRHGAHPEDERQSRNLHHAVGQDRHAASRRSRALTHAPDHATCCCWARRAGLHGRAGRGPLLWCLAVRRSGLIGYGARNPLFVNALALPALRFTRRLGGVATDLIYSGTFRYRGTHHRLYPRSELCPAFVDDVAPADRSGDRVHASQHRRIDSSTRCAIPAAISAWARNWCGGWFPTRSRRRASRCGHSGPVSLASIIR